MLAITFNKQNLAFYGLEFLLVESLDPFVLDHSNQYYCKTLEHRMKRLWVVHLVVRVISD
jgi:hypothetical protein